ncbi:MAG: hypothetical protein QM690_21480 [Sphingobium sp.]
MKQGPHRKSTGSGGARGGPVPVRADAGEMGGGRRSRPATGMKWTSLDHLSPFPVALCAVNAPNPINDILFSGREFFYAIPYMRKFTQIIYGNNKSKFSKIGQRYFAILSYRSISMTVGKQYICSTGLIEDRDVRQDGRP